jgi:hypothetical protein
LTNPYFQNFTTQSEQNLVEDVIIESIQNTGYDVQYLTRTLNNLDAVLGEDANSSFLSSITIEMYFAKPEGFDNGKSSIDSIGYFLPKEAKFLVARKRFQIELGNTAQEIRPLEGDLIFFGLTKEFFEIKYVNPESSFYQLGKNYVWELTVEKFTYANETFNTGNSDIDAFGVFQRQAANLLPPLDFLAKNAIIDTDSSPAINKTETSPFDNGRF